MIKMKRELEEARKNIQEKETEAEKLKRNVAEKDAEIVKNKSMIVQLKKVKEELDKIKAEDVVKGTGGNSDELDKA